MSIPTNRYTVSSPCSSDDQSDYFSIWEPLPLFAQLTSDEEREKKAELSSPGTYHVVMTPDSFSTLPEYADDTDRSNPKRPSESRSIRTDSPGSTCKSEGNVEVDSPNVVIVKTFKDVTRRSSSSGRTLRVSPTSEISDPLCSLSLSPILDSPPSPVLVDDDTLSVADLHLDRHTQSTALFSHFRHVVWRQLFPHNRVQGVDDSYGGDGRCITLNMDFLEQEAAHFPPVSKTCKSPMVLMLMFTAFSRHNGCFRTESLAQWYRTKCRCIAVLSASLSIAPDQHSK